MLYSCESEREFNTYLNKEVLALCFAAKQHQNAMELLHCMMGREAGKGDVAAVSATYHMQPNFIRLPKEVSGADQGNGRGTVISSSASWSESTIPCRTAATELFPGKKC